MKSQDADRLSEIEVTQAALRANIRQSQKMIDKSSELLERQRNGRSMPATSNGEADISTG